MLSFFFKQKTADDMRISDCSSDVCSSDLGAETPLRGYWSAMMHACGELPEVSIECGSVLTIRELLLETDMLTLLSRDQLRVEIEAGLHLTLPLLLDW